MEESEKIRELYWKLLDSSPKYGQILLLLINCGTVIWCRAA